MTTVLYNSVELNNLIGAFTGGLGGAPLQLRASQRSKAKAITFTYQQAAGTGNVTDRITIARLFPTDILLDWMLNISNILAGANCLLNIGTSDDYGTLNNSKFDSAIAIAVLGVYRPGQTPINATNIGLTSTSQLPLQVGTDPAGDQTSAQTVPNFGSGPISVTLCPYNAGIANNTKFSGYLLVGTGQ